MFFGKFVKMENLKAIETTGKIDKKGFLRLDVPLIVREKKVKVIVLFSENIEEAEEEKVWLKAISQNPSFDFLKDEEENIYSISDGQPFNG